MKALLVEFGILKIPEVHEFRLSLSFELGIMQTRSFLTQVAYIAITSQFGLHVMKKYRRWSHVASIMKSDC